MSDEIAKKTEIVVPVYNEGGNIETMLSALGAELDFPAVVKFVYDNETDTTLPVARSLEGKTAIAFELVRNRYGRGALNAIKTGLDGASSKFVIVSMADLSDPPAVMNAMVAAAEREGADIVCASRYMKGGSQIGGPRFKGFLSHLAGLLLHWFARLPTHDPTNSFKLYRKSFLDSVAIESTGGFELGIELVVKCRAMGGKIVEVPTTWRDRVAGKSNFKLWKWLPHYLKWFFYGFYHRGGTKCHCLNGMKRILHICDLRRPVVGLAATVFVLTLLLVLKAINRVGCPQFWAEDGTIFFAELLKSGWRSIFVVYAGYLHVGTRLCAASAMAFDPINAPVVFFYAAFLVQLIVMVVIARCGIFRSRTLGLVAAATLPFLPFAEEFLNLTNLHWTLSLLIPISLIGPECRFKSVSYWVRVAVHCVMAITNPYAIFFAPVHFVRAFFRRHCAAEVVYFLVATSFCGIQAVVLAFNLSSTVLEGMTMIEVIRGYVACFVRLGIGWVLPPSVFQEVLTMLTFRHGVSWVGIGGLAYWSVAMILMIYGIILVGVRRAFSRIWVLVWCGGAAVVAGLGRGPIVYCSDRYFYIPYVLLIVSLLKLMEMEHVTHRARIILGLVVGMYFLSSIPCYVLSELEDFHWKQEYSAALKDRSHPIKLHPALNTTKWYLLLPMQETRELRFGAQMSVPD